MNAPLGGLGSCRGASRLHNTKHPARVCCIVGWRQSCHPAQWAPLPGCVRLARPRPVTAERGLGRATHTGCKKQSAASFQKTIRHIYCGLQNTCHAFLIAFTNLTTAKCFAMPSKVKARVIAIPCALKIHISQAPHGGHLRTQPGHMPQIPIARRRVVRCAWWVKRC